MWSQATITSVNVPVQHGVELLLSWTSSSPQGTYFQIYVNSLLVWYGTSLSASIAAPTAISRIDIGALAPTDSPSANFSGYLPGMADRTVTLSWLGGTFESATIAGFNIYGETTPGGGVTTVVLATVPAYTAGIITDGYGYGGFGQGGFGESAGSYSWTSGDLTSGTWHWAVAPVDTAGNVGPQQTASAFIAVPPTEPPPFAGGAGLDYSYNASIQEITLTWQAATA